MILRKIFFKKHDFELKRFSKKRDFESIFFVLSDFELKIL